MKRLIHKKQLIYLQAALIIALATWAVINYLPYITEFFNQSKDTKWLETYFRKPTFLNLCLLLCLTALSSAIPGLSSSIFCIFNGVLFGSWIAIPLNILGNTIGNTVSFLLMGHFEKREKSKRMDKVLAFIQKSKNPFLGVCLAYMLPFIPTLLVNYAISALNFPPRKRLLATVIGTAPLSIFYAFSGDLVFEAKEHRGLILILLVLIVIGSLYYYIRHFRKEKHAS